MSAAPYSAEDIDRIRGCVTGQVICQGLSGHRTMYDNARLVATIDALRLDVENARIEVASVVPALEALEASLATLRAAAKSLVFAWLRHEPDMTPLVARLSTASGWVSPMHEGTSPTPARCRDGG